MQNFVNFRFQGVVGSLSGARPISALIGNSHSGSYLHRTVVSPTIPKTVKCSRLYCTRNSVGSCEVVTVPL